MIKAIAFDLDDTLYPEFEFVFSGYRAVSERVRKDHGFSVFEDLKARFFAGERGDLFTPVLAARLSGNQEPYIRELVKVYREHRPVISVFPEVLGVLAGLKPKYPLALISDGLLSVQKNKFDALNIAPFFSSVVFSDEWGREFWKPHPKPYQVCAERLGVETGDMVFVADNPNKDFIGARAVGMKAIRVRRPQTLHESVRLDAAHEADREINSLSDLLACLA